MGEQSYRTMGSCTSKEGGGASSSRPEGNPKEADLVIPENMPTGDVMSVMEEESSNGEKANLGGNLGEFIGRISTPALIISPDLPQVT
jgi:hypothetical protein